MTLAPFAGGSIGTDQQESDGGGDNDNKGDNKCHPPCLMRGKMLSRDKRVEDRRHQEVCYTTSSVTKTGGECVGCPDYILVEEAS